MRPNGVVNGSDIVLFINTSEDNASPNYEAVAACTSSKISYKSGTKTRATKDAKNSLFKAKTVNSVDVNISVEAFVFIDSKFTYSELRKKIKKGELVKLKYGFEEEQTGDEYEEGMFVIDSLDMNNPAQEDSTFSAQFSNSGEVETKTKS